MTQFELSAQTPTQATIVNANPGDAAILTALNGGGLTLTNGVLVNGTRNTQIAIFDGGTNAGFGMNKGVLFSTGNAAQDLASRNLDPMKGYANTQPAYSDPDLLGITPYANNDVVVYTFTVKLDNYTTALRIAFQFGSEEYPDWVGTEYNDAFGFFVTGPNINGTFNMAKIPTNQKPISVNTINGGNVGINGESTYSGLDLTQSGMYINNGHATNIDPNTGKNVNNAFLNNGPKPVFIEYNGLTKLITYDLVNLVAGGTYTFKIAIADASDQIYDSGVIIQKVQGTTGADVAIKKEVNNMNPNVGDEVEFTLTANNLGPYDGHNVEVTDLIPTGYTFVSATPSKGTYDPVTGKWTIGTLQAVYETATLKIKAKVNAAGTYTNTATILSTDPDPDATNNTTSVTPVPVAKASFRLYKTGVFNDLNSNGFASTNETITYTFKLKNTGNVIISGIQLSDPLFGGAISGPISGDLNGDSKLDINEEWVFTKTYNITSANIKRKGVYNLATVTGKDVNNAVITTTSTDPNPLPITTAGHPGIDPSCPDCTIVILKGLNLIITNPMLPSKAH